MRIAVNHALCLSRNAFCVDKALQRLHFSSTPTRAFSSTTTCAHPANVVSRESDRRHVESRSVVTCTISGIDKGAAEPGTDVDDNDVESLSEQGDNHEAGEEEASKILSKAVSRMRKHNRGYDSILLRKVVKDFTPIRGFIVSEQPEKKESHLGYHHPLEQEEQPSQKGTFQLGPCLELSPFQRFRKCERVFDGLNGVPAQANITCRELHGRRIWDYKGYPIKIAGSNDTSYFKQPNTLPDDAYLEPWERFNEELDEFLKHMQPTETDMLTKQGIMDSIEQLVRQSISTDMRVARFGSTKSGYELYHSDIDLRLYIHGYETSFLRPKTADIARLTKALKQAVQLLIANGFKNVEFVQSRFPLVSARHITSQIEVQLVASNHEGHVSDYIKGQIASHPDLLGIYAVLKTYLDVRKLSDVYYGGLGSYTLIMMVIASMKLNPGCNAGEALINFLKLYSSRATMKSVISLIPPRIDYKAAKAPRKINTGASIEEAYLREKKLMGTRNRDLPWLLSLQDPCDARNDLGQRTFAWKHIAATFEDTLRNLQDISKYPEGSYSILNYLIGPASRWHDRSKLIESSALNEYSV